MCVLCVLIAYVCCWHVLFVCLFCCFLLLVFGCKTLGFARELGLMKLALLSTRCPASCLCSVLLCLSLFVSWRCGVLLFCGLCLCLRCLVEFSVLLWVGVGGSLCFCVSASASNACVSIGGSCRTLLCMRSLLVPRSWSVFRPLFFYYGELLCTLRTVDLRASEHCDCAPCVPFYMF